MTAAAAPARPDLPRARRVASATGPALLLRIELRRSPMLWLLPLLAVLFYVSTYRPAMDNPPFWNIRSGMIQSHTMLIFAPLLAGAGAWVGSREGRRGLIELVGVTAVPRWAGQLASWAAATIWAEVLYLAGVAVLYGVTAHQGAWGGPLWWPVAVGAAVVAASCALGFAAGARLPGRFTAGLAAAGTATGLAGTARVELDGMVIPALHDAASDRPTPYTPVCSHGAVRVCLQPAYRSYLPEVTAALGPLLGQLAGLPGAPPVRVTQVAVTTVQSTRGNGINFGGPVTGGRPPVLYLPLSGLTLPGEGNTPVASFTATLRGRYGPMIVNDLVGLPAGLVAIGVNQVLGPHHAAQFAIAQALEQVLNLNAPSPPHNSVPTRARGNGSAADRSGAGAPAGTRTGAGRSGPGAGGTASSASPSPAQTQAAVDRFAALPEAARHAWLATHLAALRAGRIALSEIP